MAITTTTQQYKVKGTSDEVTACELCGRVDLKSTVALAVLDADGNETDVVYFGSDCAARAARWTQNEVRRMAAAADREARAEAQRQAREEAAAAEAEFMAGFTAWLADRYGVTGIEQMAHLWGKVPGRSPLSLRTEYQDEA